MIGIGIVTFNDLISDDPETIPDLFKMTCAGIESLNMFTKDEFIIIIRDNDSLDYRYNKFNVVLDNKYKHINTLFIPSKVNELTDAWNEILTIGFSDYNCEAMVLLNNDIIVTKYWQSYLDAIKVQSRDIVGPVASDAPYQPLQSVEEGAFVPENSIFVVPMLQGLCLGGSKRAFKENMYNNTCYFDPEIEFAFNEEEWIQRNNSTGGRCLIVMNSYIIHLNAATWHSRGLWSSKAPPNRPMGFQEKVEIAEIFDYNDYLAGSHII